MQWIETDVNAILVLIFQFKYVAEWEMLSKSDIGSAYVFVNKSENVLYEEFHLNLYL